MLSDARPLFEGLPASYADPLALAAQQAPGTSSIIVVSYATTDFEYPAFPLASSPRDQPEHRSPNHPQPQPTTPPPHHLTTPSYDLYACRGGSIVSVARTTPDFRFPIMPAVALRRFVEARDQEAGALGGDVRVALYEVTDALLRCWLETVYLAPCLKVHVRGAHDAPLVVSQLEASACTSGVLEVNDFSDVLRPRIKLLHVESVPQTGFLAAQLSMTQGRVLLYDRARNRGIARERAGEALDMEGALEQADRLASARRPLAENAAREAQRAFQRQAERAGAGEDEAHLQQYFTETEAHPRRVAPSHASAQALGELLASDEGASGQGQAHDALALLLSSWDAADDDEPPTEEAPAASELQDAPAVQDAPADASPPQGAGEHIAPDEHVAPAKHFESASANQPGPPVGPAPTPHVATELHQPPHNPTTSSPPEADLARLVDAVRERLRDAIGMEREDALSTHAAEAADCTLPPPPSATAGFLRAYLTGDPPKRWHGFKGQRRRLYAPIADDIRTLFETHRHTRHVAIDALPALWARLQR